jgi:MOSC domain-containing protein YiiM
MRSAGVVEAIHIGPEAERPMLEVDAVEAEAGRGLVGDRYFDGTGTYSDSSKSDGREVTLIASEALEAMERESGIRLDARESRRNILTRGIDLDELIGRRFRIGPVVCFGIERCDPCAHLQSLTRPGVLRGLVHRGGLRADIVEGGRIRVDDRIEPDDR